jgi:sulfatase maturation enzyme AslB (radical SAM superfamily)
MIDAENYCAMIHGGLQLDFKNDLPQIQNCCLRNELMPADVSQNFWNSKPVIELRNLNKKNQLDSSCYDICKKIESAGMESFRTGMNQGLGIYGQTDTSGPSRIDLMYDISCNLACRTCGTHSSTFWQKHLKENNLWNKPIFTPRSRSQVISALSQLDLSNLRMLVFCGGETLLGNEYWEVARWLADNVPNAKNQLTLCFQTNGTQGIHEKYFSIIEKYHLIKLHVSLDAVDEQFYYLRWPAQWDTVVENLLELRETLPSNVMFLIEETTSIFNLFYMNRLENWTRNNFSTNREGDTVVHTRHLARGVYGLQNCTQQYVDSLATDLKNLIPKNWQENPEKIKAMIQQITQFDRIRSQSFHQTFPEVADFYSRYL